LRFYTLRLSLRFVPRERTCDIVSYAGAAFNLGSRPHAKLQDVVELLRQVVPAIVIAGRVRGKIVIYVVSAPSTMCDDVIGLPLLVLNVATTNVTATGGLCEDLKPFFGG